MTWNDPKFGEQNSQQVHEQELIHQKETYALPLKILHFHMSVSHYCTGHCKNASWPPEGEICEENSTLLFLTTSTSYA